MRPPIPLAEFVDLIKLLDIDSSFAARKELATELGCPAELMGVPKDLLD